MFVLADKQGVPIYLETMPEYNVPIYQNAGLRPPWPKRTPRRPAELGDGSPTAVSNRMKAKVEKRWQDH
jgi:hypothetical protein